MMMRVEDRAQTYIRVTDPEVESALYYYLYIGLYTLILFIWQPKSWIKHTQYRNCTGRYCISGTGNTSVR